MKLFFFELHNTGYCSAEFVLIKAESREEAEKKLEKVNAKYTMVKEEKVISIRGEEYIKPVYKFNTELWNTVIGTYEKAEITFDEDGCSQVISFAW